MGKKVKKHRQQTRTFSLCDDDDDQGNTSGCTSDLVSRSENDGESDLEEDFECEDEGNGDADKALETPSKFSLYQQSVQSPKGDISYLQKFFLMYVGGRVALHLQEDFCGTALLSAEWLRSDSRRTAVGLDLDVDALHWCLRNNINRVGSDGYSRMFLFHGDVLRPSEAKVVKIDPEALITAVHINDHAIMDSLTDENVKMSGSLPARDIVCAFNYSCCCLHKRADLLLYFKHVRSTISKNGGIFVMDLYGGTSSEGHLRLQRKFPEFTYVWEQDEFDIIQRKTRISLHFHLQKQKKKLRHAFSYSWRLWSLPEIKDCLDEAGFQSVHFWIRKMPDVEVNKNTQGLGVGREIKYEEMERFEQQDSWNAYIVAVANDRQG